MSLREHRVFPRVPVHLEVHYDDASELVDSLSEGGVFIRTGRPLPPGTELVMDIHLDDGEEAPIRVKGKVVWDRLVGRQDGMGVRFEEALPPRLKKLLTARGV